MNVFSLSKVLPFAPWIVSIPTFVPIHHSLSTSEAYYAIGEEKKGTMYYSIIYFENKHYLFISSDYLLSTSYELYTSQSDFSSLENNTSQ